jgi:hypothetical protein
VLEAIKFVEDGDLWRWQLPGSKAFYAALRAQNVEFHANKNAAVFDTIAQLSTPSMVKQVMFASAALCSPATSDRGKMSVSHHLRGCSMCTWRWATRESACAALQGQSLLQEEEVLLQSVLTETFHVQLGGAAGAQQGFGRAIAVWLPDGHMALNRSELGNRLAELSERNGLARIGVVVYVEVRVDLGPHHSLTLQAEALDARS